MFKNQQGMLRLAVYDILKQNAGCIAALHKPILKTANTGVATILFADLYLQFKEV
jgi:hypothetical protein